MTAAALPLVSADLPLDGTTAPSGQCSNTAIPKPSNPPGKTMKSDDILKYLIFLKKEQIIRIAKEKQELERIEDAINQVEAGHFDIESWVKKNEESVHSKEMDSTTDGIEEVETEKVESDAEIPKEQKSQK
uniref:Uncharacterized protein n=1 Tax=Rhodnius prolixus TaxID=13249 RepID=T1I7R0_RHOPR